MFMGIRFRGGCGNKCVFERPVPVKAVVQNQNFEFPVANGCLTRRTGHQRRTVEWLHRAQTGPQAQSDSIREHFHNKTIGVLQGAM
jgi:hypothetical protein